MKVSVEYTLGFIICILIISAVASCGWLLYKQQTANMKSISNTKTKQYENKLVILFLYDGYTLKSETIPPVEIFTTVLDSIAPYKNLHDVVIVKTLLTGSNYCKNKTVEGKSRLSCDNKIFDSLKALGVDKYKAVIISPLQFNSFSEVSPQGNSNVYLSGYRGNQTLDQYKRWMGILFAQELGHSFGLSYEYINAKPSFFEKKAQITYPNCAPNKEVAKLWWRHYTTGFFSGCGGGDSYIYPEQNTLMSNLPLNPTYGRVSEDYLNGLIRCFYGNKNNVKLTMGTKTCEEFKASLPN